MLTALKNTLAHERGRWLLGSHPEARSEYRIRTPDRSYVFDRIIREVNSTRWVVDYKTSRHAGANVEAFLTVNASAIRSSWRSTAARLGKRARDFTSLCIKAGGIDRAYIDSTVFPITFRSAKSLSALTV